MLAWLLQYIRPKAEVGSVACTHACTHEAQEGKMNNTHTRTAAVVETLLTAVNAGTLTAEQAATLGKGILGDNVRVEGILDVTAKPNKRTRKPTMAAISPAKLVKAIESASKAKGGCVRALGGSIAKRDHEHVCKKLGLKLTAANSARVNAALALLVKAGGEWSHVDAKKRLHKAKSDWTSQAHAEKFIARATKRVDEHRAG